MERASPMTWWVSFVPRRWARRRSRAAAWRTARWRSVWRSRCGPLPVVAAQRRGWAGWTGALV